MAVPGSALRWRSVFPLPLTPPPRVGSTSKRSTTFGTPSSVGSGFGLRSSRRRRRRPTMPKVPGHRRLRPGGGAGLPAALGLGLANLLRELVARLHAVPGGGAAASSEQILLDLVVRGPG